MPHNLYLHSSLVQTRKIGKKREDIRQAIRWNNIDSALSLNLAFFVNAAILVVAAAIFYRNGYYQVAEIQDAHKLLQPLLGAAERLVLLRLPDLAAQLFRFLLNHAPSFPAKRNRGRSNTSCHTRTSCKSQARAMSAEAAPLVESTSNATSPPGVR